MDSNCVLVSRAAHGALPANLQVATNIQMACHARWQPETAGPLPRSGSWHAKRLIGTRAGTDAGNDAFEELAARCRAARRCRHRRRRSTQPTQPTFPATSMPCGSPPPPRCLAWMAQFTRTRCGRCSSQRAPSRRSVAAVLGGVIRPCTVFPRASAAPLTLLQPT